MGLLAVLAACHMLTLAVNQQAIGVFEGHTDVGAVKLPGSGTYDPVSQTYLVTGSGENMWSTKDAFHFVWKKVTGDISFGADVRFNGEGKNAHRKACLIIRQSLDADSAYADIALHGDGLTSLQYRDTQSSTTHEIQSNVSKPGRIQIERRDDYICAYVDGNPSGGSVRLKLKEPYYIGLGVCSHEADVSEAATFSEVAFDTPDKVFVDLYSTLEIVAIDSTDRRVVRVFKDHIEAPNWTPDGKDLVYNSGGLLYKIPITGGEPTKIDTGFATRCNNDHGISPDGKWIVVSDHSQGNNQSTIYVLPFAGGTPRKITEGTPSYWHGWSPDGKTLAFCGQRDGKFGIFTIPAAGGPEQRLTTAEKLDDGPDYSPDGKHIYFNSDRTGKMQIYRMSPEGQNIEAMTHDENNNWFAHVSPNRKWMVFLTYEPDVEGHPPNKDVMLRLMNLEDRKVTILAKLFGGQGTINVPSWSPDSKRVAFVSYQMLP